MKLKKLNKLPVTADLSDQNKHLILSFRRQA